MYMDFPCGRLKLLGTLVFPKSKYVVCRMSSGHVLLEDVFETLVRAGAGLEKGWRILWVLAAGICCYV